MTSAPDRMEAMKRDTLGRGGLIAAAVVAVVLAALAGAQAVSARMDAAASPTTPTPIYVAGNPTCTDLGYAHGFKVDPPNAGTYSIDGVHTVTVATDGVYFDWTSTIGIDAVISKGGPNANQYVYDPPAESFGDTGLHSPINATNDKPYGLSHIEFCYDYELGVTKTADTSFTRTYSWTIDKSASPSTLDMFTGDSGTASWTVAVDRIATDSDWAASGQITIHNPDPTGPATITGVTDAISGAGDAVVTCGVSFPYSLAASGTLTCSYTKALPDAAARTNTATVTTSGAVGGGSGTAAVTFGAPTTTTGYASVTVGDTNGGSWTFNGSGSETYSETFTCDTDEGTHTNTATISETGQSDAASVTVNCYAPTVTKTAATALTRTYHWTIDKSADQSALTLALGQSFLVNYQVAVGLAATPFTDSGWTVSGQITVHNPAPMAAPLTGVGDTLSGVGAVTVSCPVTFPYSLAAGADLVCSYTQAVPDATTRTNTATATLQNTPTGTTDFSGSATADFSSASVTLVDDNVSVTDTYAGALGSVNYAVAPTTFTYSRLIGPYAVCGDDTITNTATFTTDDTAATGSDSWTVDVSVPCDTGCTLTIGYWKTHAGFGPQADMVTPLLPVWLGTSGGAKSVNVTTAALAVQLLGFEGSDGVFAASNGINKLYAQLLGAKLNIEDGAAGTAVAGVISSADAFLATHDSLSWAGLTKAQKNGVLGWATMLDNYNNGLVGPGHCSM